MILTTRQFAKRYGVCPMTVSRWVNREGMPRATRGVKGRPSTFDERTIAWLAARPWMTMPEVNARTVACHACGRRVAAGNTTHDGRPWCGCKLATAGGKGAA